MSMLTIAVESLNDQSVDSPLTATFDQEGGTIGRGAGSTLVLPDPDRKISRTHAVVICGASECTLRDQGSVVPVVVNGQALGNGLESPLRTGDEIRIAGYRLRVTRAPAPDALSDERTLDGSVPFNFAASSDAAPGGAEGARPPPGTVLSWEGQGATPDGIKTVILPSPGDAAAPAAAPPAENALSLSLESEAATAAAGGEPHALPPAAATPASTDDPHAAVTSEALLAAFLTGAGIPDLTVPDGLTPQRMREIGTLLRLHVQGLLDLLAARAVAKREVRADATIIVATDNNPLKFSPSAEAALTHLLAPRGQGFMVPLRAVIDAHENLRSHQIGFMVGMQAALRSVLARFDPRIVEERCADRSLAGTLLPMTHKARLWEAFVQLYGSVQEDAQSDFHALFGKEFLRAYQAEVAHARKLAHSGPGA